LLEDVKTFLDEGGAKCLRSWHDSSWAKEFPVDAFAVEVIKTKNEG
jgi:hypothetical protein